jgi:hypothetical protein
MVEMGISLNFCHKTLKREEHEEDLCTDVREIRTTANLQETEWGCAD